MKIKVNLLISYDVNNCIKIILENRSVDPVEHYNVFLYYSTFQNNRTCELLINRAHSAYSFMIEANPDEIIAEWRKIRLQFTNSKQTCSDAAQMFLTKFANIPEPTAFSAPITINHAMFGIFLPSFIPCPYLLPGRVKDNAQFYIEARNNPDVAMQYSTLYLNVSIAIAALCVATSIIGLIAASSVLTGGTATIAIISMVTVGAASSYGLFGSINRLAAKNIAIQYERNQEKENPWNEVDSDDESKLSSR